jgi:phosphatidate cytidylyltransferase
LADATPPTALATSETVAVAGPAGPSDLRQRVIYGLIGAAMLLGSVWFSPWTFGLFFAAVQAVMLWEFYRMMRAGNAKPATWIGVIISILIFAEINWQVGLKTQLDPGMAVIGNIVFPPISVTASNTFSGSMLLYAAMSSLRVCLLLATVGSIVWLTLKEVLRWPSGGAPFSNIAATYCGLFYVSLPMALLSVVAYSGNAYDYRRVFALLFLIWASDIGAYAVGRTFGKHKLAPKISPGKTWEGWAGGFVLTLVVGWAVGFMLPDVALAHRLVAAGVVAVFAPLGDLAESMLKRSVGVKDSGRIMPGHGGLLDRFDAFLLVLPVLALLQLLAR